MSKGVRNEMGLTGVGALSVEDVRTVNVSRERFYAFLSRLFAKEVDEEALNTIVTAQPTIHSLASSQEAEELKDGSRLLQDFIGQAGVLKGKEKQDWITDLRAEYAALFLAVGMPYKGKERLLTCESAYLGKHHTYYDRPFFLVKDAYKRSGFEKRKDYLEPEDHIAVELDYMANLCKQSQLSLEENNLEDTSRYLNLQKDFLRDHLLKWVPDLCKSLKETADSKLYKSLAYLTNGFISMEGEVVDELAETLQPFISEKADHTRS